MTMDPDAERSLNHLLRQYEVFKIEGSDRGILACRIEARLKFGLTPEQFEKQFRKYKKSGVVALF